MWDSMLLPEVLHLVFSLLPPRHLKPALLVCCSWRQVGEAPSLWKNVNLRVTRENISLMPEVLVARRMLAIREITLGDVAVVEEVLAAVSQHRGVIRLNLTGTDLTAVEPQLLARVVHGVNRLYVEAAKLTNQQIEAILGALGGHTKLKILVFSKIDLTAVDSELLAWAVNRLEWVDFVRKSAILTNTQCQAIFETIAKVDTNLKYMAVPCHTVSTDVLAKALNKLEHFYGTLAGPRADRVLAQSLVQTKLTRAIIVVSKLDFDEDLVRAARKVIPHLDVSKTAVYHEPTVQCPNDHPPQNTA